MAVYKLFWDEFSSWYLEMIKPAYGQPINRKVYEATIGFFDNLLHLLHPFMPFITEELWQHLCDRTDGESLMVSPLSMSALVDEDIIREFEVVKEVISNIRSIRLQKNIAQKEALPCLQRNGRNLLHLSCRLSVRIRLWRSTRLLRKCVTFRPSMWWRTRPTVLLPSW